MNCAGASSGTETKGTGEGDGFGADSFVKKDAKAFVALDADEEIGADNANGDVEGNDAGAAKEKVELLLDPKPEKDASFGFSI